MSDKDPTKPNRIEAGDVPVEKGPGVALARHGNNSAALAKSIAGEALPDECRFFCMSCGADKTLKFDEDEMSALAGDIRSYAGPCWGCDLMTLVPRDNLMGDVSSINERSEQEYKKRVDVALDEVEKRVGKMIGGGIASMAGAAKEAAPAVDGERSDLPDADSIDPNDLAPRKSE